MATKYTFWNGTYEMAHGKAPKGTGHWAFIIENATVESISPEVFIENVNAYRNDTIFWVPGVWTLAEAKKRASVMLAANAVPEGTTIVVAP